MGLFDFLKKDDSKNEKEEIKKSGNRLEDKSGNRKGLFKKSSSKDSIDFSPIYKTISEEELKNNKEKRLKKDKRTEEEKIRDETLKEIAISHKNRNNRVAAVMEIKSQDVLEDMINIKDRFVRTVVASRISDPDILEEVILTAKYSDARRIAYDQLGREENVFAEIAKFDRKSANRNRALDEISNEVILLDIAINANDKKIRLKSTEKIENNEVLAELLKNTNH